MRKIDIAVIVALILIAITAVWILTIINPIMLPFAMGFVLLLIIFIIASFCSGRYTIGRGDDSDLHLQKHV